MMFFHRMGRYLVEAYLLSDDSEGMSGALKEVEKNITTDSVNGVDEGEGMLKLVPLTFCFAGSDSPRSRYQICEKSGCP